MSFLDTTEFDPEEVLDENRELADEDVNPVGPDLDVDAEQIAQAAKDEYAATVPGWAANPAQPEDQIIDRCAVIAADLRQLATSIPWNAIISTFASEVLLIQRRAAVPAVARAIFTATDDAGYRVDAGDTITLARTGDDRVAFQAVQATEIPPGETSVEVEMRAVVPGAQGNGLTGPGEPDEWPDWLDSVDVPAPTSQGLDAQDETEWLRVVYRLLGMVALRPVLPIDFATLVMYLIPGMQTARIVVMNTYNATTGTWGNDATETLLVADQAGQPLPATVKDEIRSMLVLMRELGWDIFVEDFGYEQVDVSYRVTTFHGQNADTVKAICDSAVSQLVSPGGWRLGTTSPGTAAGEEIPPPGQGQPPGRQTVRRSDIIARLDLCRGVDWVDTDEVLINGQAADLTLNTPTTLPTAGTITGEVLVG